MPAAPLDICFVAHMAYGALTNDTTGHIGGVERQTALMANWLAEQGHTVSVITWDEDGGGDEVLAGVRIIKVCREDAGFPVLRFFHPRWSSLNDALLRADAQLYYHNCAEAVTGQVALWAKRHGRRFAYSVASDPECDPKLPILRSLRERLLYRHGLRVADVRIVQTEHQQQMLRAGFDLESTVLKMPCAYDAGMDLDALAARRADVPRVLWLGRLARVKNVDRLLDVAEHLPHVQFDVVGGEDTEPEYARRVQARGAKIPNVTLHGRLRADQITPLLAQCWLTMCTSDWEGFPNTFLESCAYGRPLVSTVDPDNLIASLELGAVGSTAAELAERVDALVGSQRCLDARSANAYGYYYEHHALDTAMAGFVRELQAAGG